MKEREIEPIVAVIGLGYVGLPLAVAFGREVATIGYDSSKSRIEQCMDGTDITGEVSSEKFGNAVHLTLTDRIDDCSSAEFIIVAVPTPVDEAKRPDLGPLVRASSEVGAVMQKGATIVFESTVYPGATEEVCIPELERVSNLVWRRDFHVAYSPERVNPGDEIHTLEKITKLVAGDDETTLKKVSALYSKIIEAGIFEVDTIKTAEAAKVIENTQRDLNIALVNELAIIFDRMSLNTRKILEAAGTKWNFLPFRPGLVGGHCIGVDPYYLTYKAQMLGYHPEIILAGRKINDGMGKFIVDKTLKCMLQSRINPNDSTVIVMGLTFKEDCPDLRNSKVVGIVEELMSYGTIDVILHDPVAMPEEVEEVFGITPRDWSSLPVADVFIMAVGHRFYTKMPAPELKARLKHPGVIIDVKSVLDPMDYEDKNIHYWSL